jgi:hypothetical protein
MLLGNGKCSCFGGALDLGVGPDEGLALIEPHDLAEPFFARLFGPQPPDTTGLARRLNPQSSYIAMRWACGGGDILPGLSREDVRRAIFKLSANGRSAMAQAADWGPAADTGRMVDCSPGILSLLGVQTDDLVTVEMV